MAAWHELLDGDPEHPVKIRAPTEGQETGELEMVRSAWLVVEPGSGLKRCPECGDSSLEGQAECYKCGATPDDDASWRVAGRLPRARLSTGRPDGEQGLADALNDAIAEFGDDPAACAPIIGEILGKWEHGGHSIRGWTFGQVGGMRHFAEGERPNEDWIPATLIIGPQEKGQGAVEP